MSETLFELKISEGCIYASQYKTTFVIIGCGGTGGYVVRDLARMIAVSNEKYNRQDEMLLIDQDEISESNISRQNFSPSDIGQNKAAVLSARYSTAFSMSIPYIESYATYDLLSEVIGELQNVILVGCVDNNATRHILHSAYSNFSNISAYIDSGNHEFSGQVVFAAKKLLYSTNGGASSNRNIRIPDVVERFSIGNDDKHPSEMSCADHAVSSPQNIATNLMAAMVVLGYCNSIIFNSGVMFPNHAGIGGSTERYIRCAQCRPISSGVSYFNAKDGNITIEDFNDAINLRLKQNRETFEDEIKRANGSSYSTLLTALIPV